MIYLIISNKCYFLRNYYQNLISKKPVFWQIKISYKKAVTFLISNKIQILKNYATKLVIKTIIIIIKIK